MKTDMTTTKLAAGYEIESVYGGYAISDPNGDHVETISPGFFHTKKAVLCEARRIVARDRKHHATYHPAGDSRRA